MHLFVISLFNEAQSSMTVDDDKKEDESHATIVMLLKLLDDENLTARNVLKTLAYYVYTQKSPQF